MFAAIYARKSTDQSSVSDEQRSVARQVEHATAYAARHGWTIAEASVFVDDGISGAEFAARPGFVRLMSALKPRPAFQILIMSEESRLGRESIETAYALKQLITAGVRVFFYLEDRERTLDSPTDKIMLSLTAFADELERERARQRTYDAMARKARAGHVTGGRVFGYTNVELRDASGRRSHVELQVNAAEADVVRRIFTMAADGDGLRQIARRLNAQRLVAPRAQQGRPNGWAPSSVREVLYRELYRGRRVWNKTRKRNRWGEARVADRPSSEWVIVEVEPLRVVPEELWSRVHERMVTRREGYTRRQAGDFGAAVDGRGVRGRHLLAGFARCACCGGSMQAVSRDSGKGRSFRYSCATFWNRGSSICANRAQANLADTDRAVQALLRDQVLKPEIIAAAIDLAVQQIRARAAADTPRDLRRRIAKLDLELANLTETAARAGGLPAVIEALAQRSDERRAAAAALTQHAQADVACTPAILAARMRERLPELYGSDMASQRRVLRLLLTDRITFTLRGETYELQAPITLDRVLRAIVPAVGHLPVDVASPPRPDQFWTHCYRFEVPAMALRGGRA